MMNATSLIRSSPAAQQSVSAPGRRAVARRAPLRVSASSTVEAFVPSERLVRPVKEGPIVMDGSVLHSATNAQLDVIQSMQTFFGENILPLLTPVDDIWQPSDFLPASHEETFIEEVMDLRERCKDIPDELLVCLVGDMVTEEALPTYMAMVNTLDGIRDETGRSQHPYAQWTRRWIAEEKRHGDLLSKYLYLSGRINMRSVEKTIQNLISTGMDPKTENHPYLGFTFTSFQERSTKISHGGTARLAKKCGDEKLAWLCGRIAQDESRHEAAYTRTMDAIYKKDPNGAICAFADMMKKKIVMPAHFMDDGVHGTNNSGRNLFEDFSEIAERLGVYTAEDYCRNVEHLIERWNVNGLTGLSEKAQEAQEFVCALPNKVRRLAEIKGMRKKKAPQAQIQFDWLFDRTVAV